LGVINHVARNIGELKGKTQIAGTVERGLIPYAHNIGHHHADNACHMIGVIENIIDGFINAVFGVHFKTFE